LGASAAISAFAATTADEIASVLLAACCAAATLAATAAAGTILVVFTGMLETICSGLATACLSVAGNASHSATAATPSSAAVPNAAMTRCRFDRICRQNLGCMS
jgi:hypothetical protein